MKIYKLLTRTLIAASVASAAAGTAASAHSDLLVKMNALKGAAPEIVEFADNMPASSDGTTLVSARSLAEASGMFAGWDQPSQTASITLYACEWGENGVERYAAALLNSADTYGLELTPVSISVSYRPGESEAALRYNYTDSEGDTVSLGKRCASAGAELVNDSKLMIPLEDTMKLFSLSFSWNADRNEAVVSVPDYVSVPSGLSFMADKAAEPVRMVSAAVSVPAAQTVSVAVEENAPINAEPSLGTYLGRFKITHYCPCSQCNGSWGAHTAWADGIVPGQTIAVDPNVIPKLSWVYIEGYGYRRAEDCGGGINGNHIDMAVATHEEAMRKGVVYADVYLCE